MQTLKETNVKYTTKINSNGDKTVNIKTSNGANVTNVYDRHTNEFKYCYDHNSERVKTYQRDGKIYEYHDSRYDSRYKDNYKQHDDYYNGYYHKSNYNYCNSDPKCDYYNGYQSKPNNSYNNTYYSKKRYYK